LTKKKRNLMFFVSQNRFNDKDDERQQLCVCVCVCVFAITYSAR